jgi:hypothetical protein
MSSVSNNTIILDGCIEDFKVTNELEFKNDELFEIYSAYQITKKHDLSFSDIENSIVDGSNDGGIDTFIIILNDNIIDSEESLNEIKFTNNSEVHIYIGQSKQATKFVEKQLDNLLSSILFIFDLEKKSDDLKLRFNQNLIERIILFRMVWQKIIQKGGKINLNYYYVSRANEFINNYSSYQSKISQIIDETKSKIHGVYVEFLNISAKELLEYHRISLSSQLDLQFKENPIPITYDSNQDEEIGYIGVVKLNDFRNFIVDQNDSLRDNIFESNVRHYQGDVDVNKRIQNTIGTDSERDFWWLNNGITIIASKAYPFGKKLNLTNPQIVNGLQTSFSIYHYYNETSYKNDDRSILIKVIQSNKKETIDKIISSTNNQSPVSPILLRATEDLQRNIEYFFLSKGYFYDRRKNYYKNQGKPLSKIFNIQFTAQSVEAIMNKNPSAARSKPTTLIKTDKSYLTIFNESIYLNVYLNCSVIVYYIKKQILNIEDLKIKNLMKNFTFHLSLVLTYEILKNIHFVSSDIALINLESIGSDLFTKSMKNLQTLIIRYAKETDENIINTSKSQKFTEYINNNYSEFIEDKESNI